MQVNNSNMNNQQAASGGGNSPPQPRGRVNSAKSKVLVRSHAMREEASPPREPTPTTQQQSQQLNSPVHLKGPLLTLPSSRNHSPLHPSVVVSPSHHLTDSPTTICISPTATLTPPPAKRHSPIHSPVQAYNEQSYYEEVGREERRDERREVGREVGREERREVGREERRSCRVNGRHERRDEYGRRLVEEVDHEVVNHEVVHHEVVHRRNGRVRVDCGCGNGGQCCSKCLRNYNNNLSGSLNNNSHSLNNGAPNTLSVNRAGSRSSLRHQGSSQGSFDSNVTSSPRLSRDNSGEIYTDTTGTDLVRFITETINKNMKDRQLMLRIEQELIALCECTEKTHFKFPAMSSYQRMMVHRVAAFFGMDHNVEVTGKSVIVSKTAYTRIPEQRFDVYIRYDVGFCDEPPRRSILKRDSNSVEDYNFKSPDRQSSFENRRSKSIEEREEDYKRARRRIFNKEMKDYSGSTDDLDWQTQSWSSMENEPLSSCRLHPQYCYERSGLRLHKVHSEEVHEETLRPQVAKSYSFGGYAGAHHRGENVPHNGPRLLTKQGYLDLPFEHEIYVSDSGTSSSRLSPSSSGYKTQSQRSGSITPSPTSISYSGDSLRQDSTASVATNTSEQVSPTSEQQEVVWVQYSVNNAPKGREIIDPTTGTPARNPDGTIYKFDPSNVPPNVVVHHESTSKAEAIPLAEEVVTLVTTVDNPPVVKEEEVTEGSPTVKKCTSCSTCTCTPAGSTLPTRSYEPQTVPANVPVASYGAALPYPYIPSNDYMMYAPVSYETRSDGIQSTEVPVYYSDGSSAQYGAPANQWTQPFFPMGPRLPQHCVVYNTTTASTQQSVDNTMFPGTMPVFYGPPQASNHHYQPYQQNVGMVYANPVYPNGYSMYPSCPGTPNAVVPPVQGTIYPSESALVTPVNALANSFGQLSMASGGTPRHYQFGQVRSKSHQMGSVSSSSNSASPATTVVCGSYAHGASLPLRTPTQTPPNFNFGMPPPTPPAKQFNSVRASPPVGRGTSRSPTPGDIGMMDRHRFTMPPPNYQAVQYQYVLNEPRYPPRGHTSFRQQRPQSYHGEQTTNGRGQRNNRRQRN